MKGSEQEKFLKEQCDLFAFVPFNLARFKGSHLRSRGPKSERYVPGIKRVRALSYGCQNNIYHKTNKFT